MTTVALNYDLRTLGTQSYDLRISVNDTEQVDFLQINVLVQDVNDNGPMFANETYKSVTIHPLLLHYDFGYLICRFDVRENEPVDTTVGVVFAEDIDTGTFGEIVYSISGFGSEKFVVEMM